MEGNNIDNMISIKKKITEILDTLSEQIDSCFKESYDDNNIENKKQISEDYYNRYIDGLYDAYKAIKKLAEIMYTKNEYYDNVKKMFKIDDSMYSNFYHFISILIDNLPEKLSYKLYTAIQMTNRKKDEEEKDNNE